MRNETKFDDEERVHGNGRTNERKHYKSTKIRNREFGNWSNSFWDAVEKCDEENKILVMMEQKMKTEN